MLSNQMQCRWRTIDIAMHRTMSTVAAHSSVDAVPVSALASVTSVGSIDCVAAGGIRIGLGSVVSMFDPYRKDQLDRRTIIDIQEKRGADMHVDCADPKVTDSYVHSRLLQERISDVGRAEIGRCIAEGKHLSPDAILYEAVLALGYGHKVMMDERVDRTMMMMLLFDLRIDKRLFIVADCLISSLSAASSRRCMIKSIFASVCAAPSVIGYTRSIIRRGPLRVRSPFV